MPSAGSRSPTQISGHERRWWERLLHDGLLLLLYGRLRLLHGRLRLLHGRLWLLHGRLLLLHSQLLLELRAGQRLLVGMLLLSLLRPLHLAGRGLLVLLVLQLLCRA